jgi:hypothetical protein
MKNVKKFDLSLLVENTIKETDLAISVSEISDKIQKMIQDLSVTKIVDIAELVKQLKYDIKPNKITIEENPDVMFKTSGELYASGFRSDIFEGWQGMEPKQKPEPVRQDRSDILAEELNILQYHVMSRKYG